MPESSPTTDILRQVLVEYGDRISIDGGSKLLVSDSDIALHIAETTKDVRTPYGPSITIATRGDTGPANIPEGVNCNAEPLDSLNSKMDFFTHSFFGVSGEDPKFIMEGLKWMKYSLRPKGIAVVVALKQESGKAEDGSFTVGLDDKITYQSKGRVQSLQDMLEWAGFERGKIRTFDMSSEKEFSGKKAHAQVVLAMKWDQLTA